MDGFESKMIVFQSNEERPLVELKEACSSIDVQSGEITKSDRSDLHFDPVTTGLAAYKVLAVITTLGAAIQVIDWLHSKLQQMKESESKVIVKVGKSVIYLDSSKDLEENLESLRVLLSDTRDS